MKGIRTWIILAVVWQLAACGENEESPRVMPEATGTFVDVRDGEVYHYARYGTLEWTCENARYVTEGTSSTIYQDADVPDGTYSTEHLPIFGCLYTQTGAREAVPAGWRLPSDEDWQNLERHLGMSAADAARTEWCGAVAGWMLARTDDNPVLGLLPGGYFTRHTWMGTSGYRFMGAYAFYWTSTPDESKAGEYYYYRKLIYNRDEVYRQSMEPENQMLSVRFVRDVQSDDVDGNS